MASSVYGNECLKLINKNARYAGLFEPARMLAVQRNGQPLTLFSKVEFSKDNDRVILTGKDGTSASYSIGNSEDMSSRFIIQEAKL